MNKMMIQLTLLLSIVTLTFDEGWYLNHSNLEAVMELSIKQLPNNTFRYSIESISEL